MPRLRNIYALIVIRLIVSLAVLGALMLGTPGCGGPSVSEDALQKQTKVTRQAHHSGHKDRASVTHQRGR